MVLYPLPRISLAAARVNAGKTQKEWASLLNVDISTISNWEKGKTCPDLKQLKKISAESKIPMDFIYVPD